MNRVSERNSDYEYQKNCSFNTAYGTCSISLFLSIVENTFITSSMMSSTNGTNADLGTRNFSPLLRNLNDPGSDSFSTSVWDRLFVITQKADACSPDLPFETL